MARPAPATPKKPAKGARAKPAKKNLKYVESNVISLAGRSGFRWQSKTGAFLFNPYVLAQARLAVNYVDDEGLNLADPDNFINTGFGIPNALLGVAGRAFNKLTFNLTVNLACAGKACLLNQVWTDINVRDEFRIRVGKFKTPMHWSTQVRLGQTQFPILPESLSTIVNIPFDINAVNPALLTGFDIGIMFHGRVANKFEYQVGIFNGEGIGVNAPTSSLSDDTNVPSLLYAARVAYTPFGPLGLQEGGPEAPRDLRLSIGASVSYNVEANFETSNDLRAGLEVALSVEGFYWSLEGYLLHMDFVERQDDAPSYLFWGAHTQAGYTFQMGLEPVVRVEVFDRNSVDEGGVLIMPSVGLNYYLYKQNLKIQAMYRYLARAGHDDDFAANDDDNSMSEHVFVLQLQFVL